MTVKAQIIDMMDKIPDNELMILLEVIRHFVPVEADDSATQDDLNAHMTAMQEYANGETISHDSIDWD